MRARAPLFHDGSAQEGIPATRGSLYDLSGKNLVAYTFSAILFVRPPAYLQVHPALHLPAFASMVVAPRPGVHEALRAVFSVLTSSPVLLKCMQLVQMRMLLLPNPWKQGLVPVPRAACPGGG